jgi:hypothetical protein
MTKRVLLAGFLGGVAMFFWAFLAHMILPLGEAGVQEIPNEQAVLSSLQSAIGPGSGIYLFPGMGLGANPTRQQQNAALPEYTRKYAANPSGLLVYHPAGRQLMTFSMLFTEFLTELIESMLAVLLLAQTRLTGFGSRVAFVTAIGVIAGITTNISYWNWYAFPTTYTVSYITTQVAGFVCAGIVAAAVLGKGPLGKSAPSASSARERQVAA